MRERGGIYPLVPGNRSTYVLERHGEVRTLSGALVASGTIVADVRRAIECLDAIDGHPWWVQLDRYRVRGESSDALDWVRLRQDREGLYELEIIPTTPYPCSPLVADPASTPSRGAALEKWSRDITEPSLRATVERTLRERANRDLLGRPARGSVFGSTTLVRLRYPLHVGATWAIRPERDTHGTPVYSATVEAHEVLDLPAGKYPAARVRIHSPFFRPDDRVVLWYGRAGFLAMRTHQTYDITDENGTRVGSGMEDATMRLTGIGDSRVASMPPRRP